MSRSDIICAIALLCFVSACFAGLSAGATWSAIVLPQGSAFDAYFGTIGPAIVGIESTFVCIFLSVGLWKHPDHDAVLGRC